MELKDTEHALLICKGCGAEFLAPRHSHRQYCDKCVLTYWGKRVKVVEKQNKERG